MRVYIYGAPRQSNHKPGIEFIRVLCVDRMGNNRVIWMAPYEVMIDFDIEIIETDLVARQWVKMVRILVPEEEI